ncbi:MAG TPA: NYN domain-containing protein [Woeseiaceae bacterium]|nr:NYN domain-containing protein [Woeseiaceae bacterium]
MNDDSSLALFCDFENIALGVRDSRHARFDIRPVLERLLVKGSIVAKKAYCDWDRYKEFKPAMHEAAFELIEIPHVRMSGKNSADIRMVVDALDLCYTKDHIDTFVIISGDSDFSPLVSKLRENAKTVIGVGVKNSTSDLLISNCDEFIFYDELVSDGRARAEDGKGRGRKKSRTKKSKTSKPKEEDPAGEAIDLVLETVEALYAERGDSTKIWGSMVKQALKRRRPGFNESSWGFRSFSELLEEAQDRNLLQLELDEKSGGYVIRKVTA